MKVVSAHQMAYIESLACRDGASESEFMEEAGTGIALAVNDFIDSRGLDHEIILLCGKGNNAGDAYIAGLHLIKLGYEVTAYQIAPINNCSSLCQQGHYRFVSEGGSARELTYIEDFSFPTNGIIIDGIFGTGFSGEVKDPYFSIIKKANESKLPIIAIDTPSGLNGDTGEVHDIAIVAAATTFLGLPKTGFFLKQGWSHVGKLLYIDFGLPKEYVEETEFDFIMLSTDIVKPLLPPIKNNWHKYERGYVIGLAGSPGMPGAAVLSSWSALNGGAGIVRLLYPEGMETELSAIPYELIKTSYNHENYDEIVNLLNEASAFFIGPGLGRKNTTKILLQKILPHLIKPCVIDADALTLIADSDIKFPEKTILTPHKGEMQRLLKSEKIQNIDSEFLKTCQKYSEDNKITLILKGGTTFIFHPDKPIMVNARGDPGMATAGSGDVLTGLLTALLAQGMIPHEAAILGVYLHAIAGEFAAYDKSSYCITAGDIIDRFPEAFLFKNTESNI